MNFSDENENIVDKEVLAIFQVESEEIIERILNSLFSLETTPANKEVIAAVYRDLHSLKGAVRMVGFNNIQIIIHRMEDIFDAVNHGTYYLETDVIRLLEKTIDQVTKYLKQSTESGREIIDEDFSAYISNLEYIIEVEMKEQKPNNTGIAIQNVSEKDKNDFAINNQEKINTDFNTCFEIIDGIVPEEESQDIVVLKEEIQKIYEFFKESDMYEVKSSLENLLTKLDFVMKATNTLTISEILEIRNELSSAAAKYTTYCIEKEDKGISFFDISQKFSMLQSSSVYAKEIKDEILNLKENIDDSNIIEIINLIVDILDFILENSAQIEEQMIVTLKSGIEYCASSNENIDSELIVQQLEIMKQLLELNYKKDSGINEVKNLSLQTTTNNSNSSEIKTLHVNAHKLDLLVNQLGELIMTKIKTEKNLEKIDAIKLSNEICQKDLLKTSNYLRYYNRKYLQSGNPEQYTSAFVKQVFSLLSDITQNVSRTIYDLNSMYRVSKEDDMKMRLIIDEMESMVKNIRVLPISTVFNSFARMVRDIANEKGKEINFEIEGKDTCADKKIVEEIKTPLIHILRNAIDHGIESKEDRLANGKNPVGRILLSAKQDENSVIIDVIDDGQGFNLQKIKDRAVSRGFLTQEDVDNMTDEAIMNVIFWPGFTTGDSITSISGRGIGLDVVKTKISQLNGKVKVISEFGKGSCVHIEIPVTLTTLRVFLVKISGQTFAIPINVIKTFLLKKQTEINTNNGIQSIVYNDEILPIFYLSDILDMKQNERNEKEIVLVIESDEKKIGLIVDKLIGDQDILQKKLSPPLYKVKNISGITNLASGELCLILNIQDIIHYDFNKINNKTLVNSKKLPSDIMSYKRILVIDDSITTRSMIKNILLNVGYNVDAAYDVEEALAKLKLNHYDLLITDFTMPNIDGGEFIQRLKNDEMYADIPIILITSLSKKEFSNKISEDQIDFYMSKSKFDQVEFLNQVNRIISKYHV